MTTSFFPRWSASLMLFLAGCAVQQTPAQLSALAPAAESGQQTLSSDIEWTLNTGYVRRLKKGSGWTKVGRLPQGDVYQPRNDVFTLEGAHIHEAYLVIEDGVLVGFYLPAERAFSPSRLHPAISLH